MTGAKGLVKTPAHLIAYILDDKKEHFSKNNRMAMMLRLLDKIPELEKEEIKNRALSIIENPDEF